MEKSIKLALCEARAGDEDELRCSEKGQLMSMIANRLDQARVAC